MIYIQSPLELKSELRFRSVSIDYLICKLVHVLLQPGAVVGDFANSHQGVELKILLRQAGCLLQESVVHLTNTE